MMKLFTKLLLTLTICGNFSFMHASCELFIENDGQNPIVISSKKLKQPKDFISFPGIKIDVAQTQSFSFDVLYTLFVYELINGTYAWRANVLPLACPTVKSGEIGTLYYREIIGELPQPDYLEVNGKRATVSPDVVESVE